jgi:hypothetical protein
VRQIRRNIARINTVTRAKTAAGEAASAKIAESKTPRAKSAAGKARKKA